MIPETLEALELLEWLALGIDLVGVAIVLLGFVFAIARFLPTLVQERGAAIAEIAMIRCFLGSYLVFALELMIISDLLHSVISRNLEDLYFLGGIVALRTLIGYFLGKEIEALQKRAAR